MKTLSLFTAVAAAAFSLATATFAASPARPNIVLLYADDLGYGDLGCYGATKVKTPNLDRLAAESLRFTDAHSPAATCTPSRYSLLTGEYAWRRQGTGILPGDAALIIQPGRTTLPGMLKQAGYATAVVGKWHLGLGDGNLDWNKDIKPGPLEIGFDYSFILPATGDRVPCVYVEGHRVVGLDPADPIEVNYKKPIGNEPTGKAHPELLKMKANNGHADTIVNGIGRIGFMSGGKAARWNDENMAEVITRRAVKFIEQHTNQPFFLYFATHDIHVPRVPGERFRNSSQCGVRGDVIQQFDWSAGEVLAALDRLGLKQNTLVIMSSDNGPVVIDGYTDGAWKNLNGHTPAGPYRGGKYTAYEGGTRMPFLVRWPERVKPGVSDALLCQIDLLASFASLVGTKLPADAAPDSLDVLPALLGESKTGRDHLVEQGGPLALRVGSWKYISGVKAAAAAKRAEPACEPGDETSPTEKHVPGGALYDLASDLGEKDNLAAKNPAKLKELEKLLSDLKEKGKTR